MRFFGLSIYNDVFSLSFCPIKNTGFMRFYIQSLATLFFAFVVFNLQAQNVSQSTTKDSKQFGPSVETPLLQLSKSENDFQVDVVDSDTYILQPGDRVGLQFQGTLTLFIPSITINPSGFIILPEIGSFKVADLTINGAQKVLEEFTSKKLNKTTLTYFGLDKARNITVDIVGFKEYTISYSLPGLVRFNVVIEELFPNLKEQSLVDDTSKIIEKPEKNSPFHFDEVQNNSTSFRTVIIKNKTGQEKQIDYMYYLRAGNKEQNPVLQNGDLIFFKKRDLKQPRVSISGQVNFSGEFAYKKNESIFDIIRLGSGFTTNADTLSALVYNGNSKKEIPQEKWATTILEPNDRVIILPNEKQRLFSSAWVFGEVNIQGNFSIVDQKTTVAELLEKSGGVLPHALKNGAFIIRNNSSSIENVNERTNYELLLQRTSDQYIQGLEYLNLESKLGRNRINIDLNDSKLLNSAYLNDGDKLYIPRDFNTVTVFGQVMVPGQFTFVKGKTPLEYINGEAGGVSNAADANRIFVIKAGTLSWYTPENTQLESGDLIFVDRVPYADFDTKRQLDISNNNVTLSIWGLVIQAVSTTALLLSIILR